jgi:ABC-type branched-subunit amino acid transport system substrate-binding protein
MSRHGGRHGRSYSFFTAQAIAAFAALHLAAVWPAPADQPEPFFDARKRQTEYAGPGREIPQPADVADVPIGYFGPNAPNHPEGGDLWCAAQMAIDQANREGGYRGKPFRLVPGWSDSPWTAGAAHVTRMVYQDKVWAVLGGIDGATTHLAEQVVAKARLPLLSAASTDRTANSANVAWMYSCLPGDHVQAPVLAEAIAARLGRNPLVVVSCADHDARQVVEKIQQALGARQMVPAYRFVCERPEKDLGELTARVIQTKAAGVLVAGSAGDSARLVAGLRSAGFEGLLFGGATFGRRRFVEEARDAAEGVLFPLLDDPPSEAVNPTAAARARRFRDDFRKQFGRSPDYAAACTYDSIALLVAAVRKAGLNRARIGDALRQLSPWQGVAGTIRWDTLGSNARPIRLGTIRDGRVVPVSP